MFFVCQLQSREVKKNTNKIRSKMQSVSAQANAPQHTQTLAPYSCIETHHHYKNTHTQTHTEHQASVALIRNSAYKQHTQQSGPFIRLHSIPYIHTYKHCTHFNMNEVVPNPMLYTPTERSNEHSSSWRKITDGQNPRFVQNVLFLSLCWLVCVTHTI